MPGVGLNIGKVHRGPYEDDFRALPIFVKVRLESGEPISFFAEGGAGYAFADYQLDPKWTQALANYGLTANVSIDDTAIFFLGGGLLAKISNGGSLGLSVFQGFMNPTATVTFSDGSSRTQNIDASRLGVGLQARLKFN